MTRYVAKVGQILRRIQTVGLPPSLSGDLNSSVPMPDPAWLVIEISQDGHYLYRYTDSGEFAGDTWHQTLEDAQHQATFEYGSQGADWVEVPSTFGDAVQFAKEHFKAPPS